MIYIACPTCGYFIGSKAEEFETKKKLICEKKDISEDKRNTEIRNLIQSLNLRRYCCKMRLMTCKDIVQDIQPIVQNI